MPFSCVQQELRAELRMTARPVSQAHKGAFEHVFRGSVELHSFPRSFVMQEESVWLWSVGEEHRPWDQGCHSR